MTEPQPEDVRRALAPLDARRRKIVAGLLTVLMRNPSRVRDREWVAEQLTELTLLAGDFDAESAGEAVEEIQEFLRANSAELLAATLLLFQRVALDLQPRAAEGFTLEDAVRAGLAYFPASEPD